eukprot:8320-Heterococcus_DN1.PRE.6
MASAYRTLPARLQQPFAVAYRMLLRRAAVSGMRMLLSSWRINTDLNAVWCPTASTCWSFRFA